MSFFTINSISRLHEVFNYPKPKHPLITWLDAADMEIHPEQVNMKVTSNFYMVSMKDKSCGLEYGRNSFDFEEGVVTFSAPGQVLKSTETIQKGKIQGWMLLFHPDLVRNTHLGSQMESYSFFNYDVVEALHVSEEEETTINATVGNIKSEYERRIDNHSQRVIVSNLELLLNYCLRFYERQFHTRSHQNKDVISQFERELQAYFKGGQHLESGLPSIHYFADRAHLSQHYFSDLIKKETGRKPKDHINDYVIEKAKHLLLSTEQSLSEVAYDLGFNYPHYFTRLFKSKTGLTPVEYRNSN